VFDPLSWAIIIGLGALGAAAVVVAWSAVSNWLDGHRHQNKTAKLIKTAMSNGKISVVAGVFDRHGTEVDSNTWEAERLDSELAAKFGANNVVRISL
jgi:hypothetical protein